MTWAGDVAAEISAERRALRSMSITISPASENVESSGLPSRLFDDLLLLFSTNVAGAQLKVPVQECGLKSLQVCVLHVAQDEVGIITSPFHLSAPSYYWLLPFGAATGIALDTDNEAMQAVGFDTSRQNEFRRISDFGGLYGPSAFVAVGYIAGSVTHNGHLQQTAVLAGEARCG